MLDSQTLAMMAEGTGATLYMTLMSTLFGYILGLLSRNGTEGTSPESGDLPDSGCDCEYHKKYSVPDFNDSDYAVYPYSGRENLRDHSNHRTACSCGSTVYCAYGGIFPFGSGSRSN